MSREARGSAWGGHRWTQSQFVRAPMSSAKMYNTELEEGESVSLIRRRLWSSWSSSASFIGINICTEGNVHININIHNDYILHSVQQPNRPMVSRVQCPRAPVATVCRGGHRDVCLVTSRR